MEIDRCRRVSKKMHYHFSGSESDEEANDEEISKRNALKEESINIVQPKDSENVKEHRSIRKPVRYMISETESDDEYMCKEKKKGSKSAKGKRKSKSSAVSPVKEKDAKRRKTGKLKPSDFKDDFKDIIAKWRRPVATKPKPKFVEVLRGFFRKSFVDEETFKITILERDSEPFIDFKRDNMLIEVNIPLLEYKILTGTLKDVDLESLFELINKCVKQVDMKEFNKPRMPSPAPLMQQPSDIQLKLKDYQINTLAWMMQIEGGVGQEWEVSKLIKWKQSGSLLEFDLNQKRIYMAPVPKSSHTQLKMKARGGIFADEMGLGKTVTLMSLFVQNRATHLPCIPDPTDTSYQVDFTLQTRATLVVAPSHLTGMWKDEVEKHAPSLKVILITTKPQYEKVTYADIMVADIVVVSVQFLLTNKAFTTLPTGRQAETQFMNFMRKPGQNPLLQSAPNLTHFFWWRIVCDEGHELLTYNIKSDRKGEHEFESKGLTALCKFKSMYRWYVTGTPFPHQERSLKAALKFLDVSVDDQNLMNLDGSIKITEPLKICELKKDLKYIYPLYRLILDQFFVRNTKNSVGEDYDVPEFVEELILLTMSDVEKGIYERAVSELERRQICCHLQIAGRLQHLAGVQQKTLEEVKVSLLEHAKMEIRRTEGMKSAAEKDVEELKETVKHGMYDPQSMRLGVRLRQRQDDVKRYNEDLAKHQSAVNYFQSLMPRITHSKDEPCVICMDTIDRLTVTPCGHFYCHKCIMQCLNEQGLCPTCRNSLTEKELIEVKDAATMNEVVKHSELLKLTEQYGTKMAYLIFYLRHLFKNDPNSKVIVFSQWDALLNKIGETLSANDIKNVFVKGNVHCRNKAISSFQKQEKTRVIMLSLEHAASGTNLVEASHVVLIDPVAGSKEEAIAVETQAIGRAHRMGQSKQIIVSRMIMKDTIEHELYLRNNSEDIQQVEFDFDNTNKFGPQIMRKQKKMPEADPIQVQAYFERMNPQASSSRNRNRNRGWSSFGWGRRRRFGQWMQPTELFYNNSSDSDDESCVVM